MPFVTYTVHVTSSQICTNTCQTPISVWIICLPRFCGAQINSVNSFFSFCAPHIPSVALHDDRYLQFLFIGKIRNAITYFRSKICFFSDSEGACFVARECKRNPCVFVAAIIDRPHMFPLWIVSKIVDDTNELTKACYDLIKPWELYVYFRNIPIHWYRNRK